MGGNTNTRSFDVPIGYVRTFGKVVNNARLDFNRSRTSTQNLYAFNQDITGSLGITGVSTNPFDWGLPNLSFTHFGSLNDINSAIAAQPDLDVFRQPDLPARQAHLALGRRFPAD